MLSIALGAMLVRVSAAVPTVSLLVKSTVVLAVAHVGALALKRRPAAERHALWLAVLASLAVLPILVSIPPTSNLHLLQLPGAPISGIRFQVHALSTPGDRVTSPRYLQGAAEFVNVDGPSPRCIYVILCFGNQAGAGIGSGAGWR